MEAATSGKCIDKTRGGIRGPALTATYRFNKIIATATIRFIVTVAIAIYKGSIPVARRMLTENMDGGCAQQTALLAARRQGPRGTPAQSLG